MLQIFDFQYIYTDNKCVIYNCIFSELENKQGLFCKFLSRMLSERMNHKIFLTRTARSFKDLQSNKSVFFLHMLNPKCFFSGLLYEIVSKTASRA